MQNLLMSLTLLFLTLTLSCQATPTPQPTPATPATPTVTQPPQPTLKPTDTPKVTDRQTISLTFWTVEEISPSADDDRGDFVAQNIRTFENNHDGTQVEIIVKKPTGKGGVLDFLRTARKVAPTVWPDVAIIDATDLEQAVFDDLVVPLDRELDRSIVQDLLPAARKMGTVEEKLMGIPLGLEVQHLIYNTERFTTTPILWTDILTDEVNYVFPAKGNNGLVNSATLSQYFSAGGTLLDNQGLPQIDESALREVLDFYENALEQGVITSSVLEFATPEEVWPSYLEGGANVAHINVQQYLTNRTLLENTDFAPILVPQETDTSIAITRGWVLVLITTDPDRQDMALNFMEWLLSTTNNAEWSRVNQLIPTRDSAYQQIAGEAIYWQFLADQLNSARPQPRFPGYDRLGRIMQQAVQDVISGEASAEEATANAIDALAQ